MITLSSVSTGRDRGDPPLRFRSKVKVLLYGHHPAAVRGELMRVTRLNVPVNAVLVSYRMPIIASELWSRNCI
ncbi:Uncharacterized protein HZ326_12978 [Fusarium oxysporum f. sp. albedinis]|nr:Uncharacterized protein HZ326_12978 [Fusarium oxysporum f. sp. albedinis]